MVHNLSREKLSIPFLKRVAAREGFKLELEDQVLQAQDYILQLQREKRQMEEAHIREREEIAKNFVLESEKTSSLQHTVEKLTVEMAGMKEKLKMKDKQYTEATHAFAEAQLEKKMLKLRLSQATVEIDELTKELDLSRQMNFGQRVQSRSSIGKSTNRENRADSNYDISPHRNGDSKLALMRERNKNRENRTNSFLPELTTRTSSASLEDMSELSLCRKAANPTRSGIFPQLPSQNSLVSRSSTSIPNLPQNSPTTLLPTPPSKPSQHKRRNKSRRVRRANN